MILEAPMEAALDGPVVFLAGPIQFPTSWQDEAIAILGQLDPALHVANPRRPWNIEALSQRAYEEQVDWETRWLRRAGQDGVVLFWLARERHHRCDRAHAQATRFELAEWNERARSGEARLVLGIEDGFSGARYVRRRVGQDNPRVIIRGTLEETCRDAVAPSAGASRNGLPSRLAHAGLARRGR